MAPFFQQVSQAPVFPLHLSLLSVSKLVGWMVSTAIMQSFDNLCLLSNLACLFVFKINFFEKLFQEYPQSVKQFGFRSGPTFCRA